MVYGMSLDKGVFYARMGISYCDCFQYVFLWLSKCPTNASTKLSNSKSANHGKPLLDTRNTGILLWTTAPSDSVPARILTERGDKSMICRFAGITQLAECQICNLNVVGANPTTGFDREWCNGSTSDFN